MDGRSGGSTAQAEDLVIRLEERTTFSRAVRSYADARVAEVLEHAGAVGSSDLIACAACDARVILLNQPRTWAHRADQRVCAGCAAERDVIALYRTDIDIGGEGGG